MLTMTDSLLVVLCHVQAKPLTNLPSLQHLLQHTALDSLTVHLPA